MIPPQSALGKAISYTLNQWDELNVFLTDARIPVDNNASERGLRKVALGRKNSSSWAIGTRARTTPR